LIDDRDDEFEHNKNLEAKLSKNDPRVQRRILRFVNAARRPEHLAQLPNQGIKVIGSIIRLKSQSYMSLLENLNTRFFLT